MNEEDEDFISSITSILQKVCVHAGHNELYESLQRYYLHWIELKQQRPNRFSRLIKIDNMGTQILMWVCIMVMWNKDMPWFTQLGAAAVVLICIIRLIVDIYGACK